MAEMLVRSVLTVGMSVSNSPKFEYPYGTSLTVMDIFLNMAKNQPLGC